MNVPVVLPREALAEIASGRNTHRALTADRFRLDVESGRIPLALPLAPLRRKLTEGNRGQLRLDPAGVHRIMGYSLDGRDAWAARRVRTAHPGGSSRLVACGRSAGHHNRRPETVNPARSSNQVSRGSTTGVGAAGSFTAAQVGSLGTPILPTSRNNR